MATRPDLVYGARGLGSPTRRAPVSTDGSATASALPARGVR
jgi:hypothetical protein